MYQHFTHFYGQIIFHCVIRSHFISHSPVNGHLGFSTFWLFWITKVKSESKSCSVVSESLRPHGLYSPLTSPGQNTGVGSLSLLQGIFPTQGQNAGLLHCRRILYQLCYQGSLFRIMLLWIFMYKCLCRHMLLFLLGIYLGSILW